MTISELIKELQKYDGNTKVNVYGFAEFDCGYIEGWFGGNCDHIEYNNKKETINLYSEKRYDWDDEDDDEDDDEGEDGGEYMSLDERKEAAREHCAFFGWGDVSIDDVAGIYSDNLEEKAEIAAYLHEEKPKGE